MKLKILAIETSCDDTSVAIINDHELICYSKTSAKELSDFGGIVPEIAARRHEQYLIPLINKALLKANLDLKDLNYLAVTFKPGMKVCLNVGLITAKTLSNLLNKPLIKINHIYAHFFAVLLEQPITLKYPFLGVIVSGGNTAIFLVKSTTNIIVLNETADDAVGEVYDKIGKAMGINYPAGPEIDKLFDPLKTNLKFLNRNLPVKNQFSFSGLKTQVLNYLNTAKMNTKEIDKCEVLSSFQKTIIDIVIQKINYFKNLYEIKQINIGGGVASNNYFRSELKKITNCEVNLTLKKYCGDNALMIALMAKLILEN